MKRLALAFGLLALGFAAATTNSTATRAEPKSASARPESNPGTNKAGSTIHINIDKTTQKMTVFLDGIEKYSWPVSTGKAGYSTPSGAYTATSMNEIWYSKQWDNSPMPHSIFFIKDGHAIHGSYEVKNLGRPVSHGCVRISTENAAKLYALVQENGLENTQVVLTGVTPGGEYKVASSGKSWLPLRSAGFRLVRARRQLLYPAPAPPRLFRTIIWRSLLQRTSGLQPTTTGVLPAARILRPCPLHCRATAFSYDFKRSDDIRIWVIRPTVALGRRNPPGLVVVASPQRLQGIASLRHPQRLGDLRNY